MKARDSIPRFSFSGKGPRSIMKKRSKKQQHKEQARRAHKAQISARRTAKKRAAMMAASLPAGVVDCRTEGAKRRFDRAESTPRPQMPRKVPRAEQKPPRRDERVTEGLFHGNARGFGFVTPAEGGEDIFIPATAVHGATDGDTVRVRYHAYTARRGGEEERREGEVTAILALASRYLVGTLYTGVSGFGRHRRRYAYVKADNPRIGQDVWLEGEPQGEDGDKVEVLLSDDRARGLHGRVSRVFGPATDRRANYEAILSALDVRTEFPEAVIREAKERAARPLSEEGRFRPENEVILTIDGAGAKDLDDAVSLRRLPRGGWLLGVHIADVSEYVTAGSETEREAMRRGTSLYFADRVVPMLPEALSNGACSLNAGEDKYALSAFLTLSEEGEIKKTEVRRTLIRSRLRGVYEEVNDLFARDKESEFYGKYRAVLPALTRMRELYAILAKRAKARGAMEFDRPEPILILDEAGDVQDIRCRERGEAERLIEQFMLTANEGVATLCLGGGIPCVYRVHERPEAGKLQEFLLYAHNLGLKLPQKTGEEIDGHDLAALLEEADEKGISRAVSYSMLRAMAKAKYSEKCTGHFGLGIANYCHFTSPIRRLSDLMTHRMIKAVLLDGEAAARYKSLASRAAEAASDTELRALEAEREIEALYKTAYLAKQEGEELDATVSGCAAFGIFAELANTCEGMIPLEDLEGDVYYDETTCSVRAGERVFTVGTPIRIRVEEADISRRRVRFSLVE